MTEKFPDLNRLRQVALLCVVATYLVLLLLPVSAFMAVALPRSWPEKSFFNDVPRPEQAVVVTVLVVSFLIPGEVRLQCRPLGKLDWF